MAGLEISQQLWAFASLSALFAGAVRVAGVGLGSASWSRIRSRPILADSGDRRRPSAEGTGTGALWAVYLQAALFYGRTWRGVR